jgi:hypothetical protein
LKFCDWLFQFLALHAVAVVALKQRKCHRTVATAAVLSAQHIEHAEASSTSLGFEQPLMAIAAFQPYGVFLVRE